MQIDRSELNRLLAKAIAYKNCGSHEKASLAAKELVRALGVAEILNQVGE